MSFDSLVKLFRGDGLAASPVKGGTAAFLIRYLNRDHSAVVQLKVRDDANHFIALVGLPNGKVGVIDYPNPPAAIDALALENRVGRFMTGNVILVSTEEEYAGPMRAEPERTTPRPPRPAEKALASALEEYISGESVVIKRLAVASLPTRDGLVATVEVRNIGRSELQVINVKGACSCFRGYSGEKRILPQQSGKLELRFDHSRLMDLGARGTSVAIETSDPKLPVAFIKVMRMPQSKVGFFEPQICDLGRISLSVMSALEIDFAVLREPEFDPVSIEDLEYNCDEVSVRFVRSGIFRYIDRVWSQTIFRVRLANLALGNQEHHIYLRAPNGVPAEMRIVADAVLENSRE